MVRCAPRYGGSRRGWGWGAEWVGDTGDGFSNAGSEKKPGEGLGVGAIHTRSPLRGGGHRGEGEN